MPAMRWGLVRALCLAALGVSALLLWGSWGNRPLPGCGPDSGCGTVLQSRWAYLFGIPVSLPACLTYLALLGGTVAWRRATTAVARSRVAWLLCALATTLIGAAFWFIGLQLFATKAVCPFCMAAHACGLLAGGLILRQGLPAVSNRSTVPAATRPPKPFLPPAVKPVLAGFAGVLLLAAAQIVHQPPTYEIQALDQPALRLTSAPTTSTNTEPAPAAPSAEAAKPSRRPTLKLYGGEFGLNLDTVPVLGSPDAPCVMLCLFDYTCDHCRQLHPRLVEAVHARSNRLAVAFMPVPLDAACNPVVKRPILEHARACEYARTALAVWRADPVQGHAYDEWFFAQPRQPSLEAARDEALRLVGSNVLANALLDPRIDRQLAWSTSLYHTNYLRYGRGALPQLMLGTNLVFGVLRSSQDLQRLLSAGCGLE